MTCIVAYKGAYSVAIGGDSAGVSSDHSVTVRRDPKVFVNGPFLIGYTTSFRMGQILMDVPFPKQPKGMDDFKYMRTLFIDAVRKAFKDGGFVGKRDEDDDYGDSGGCFVVVYKGEIYSIETDFQVGLSANRYEAVGCGGDFAKGAIEALERAQIHFTPEEFCREALKVSCHLSGGVREPFTIIEIPIKGKK